MWPVFVEVALILAEYISGVSLVDDQDAVEQFAADGSDEALGDRVRPRRLRWRLDDPDIDRGEHGIEGGGELGVAVADEEPEAPIGFVEVHEQVAGLLGDHSPVGWAVTPRTWTRRVACSMTKNAYSRCRVIVSR